MWIMAGAFWIDTHLSVHWPSHGNTSCCTLHRIYLRWKSTFFLIDARAHFRFFIKTHFCTSYSAFDEWFWDRNSNWQVHCIAQHLASLSSSKQVLFNGKKQLKIWSERASIQSFEGVRTWNWSLCSVESIALQSELKISDFRQVWENVTMPYFFVSPQSYIWKKIPYYFRSVNHEVVGRCPAPAWNSG